ncbi:cryptochrome/photolyase family protein [Pseudanabaena sp. PCC 6802]|uniref:cryptochrome/photolyase family protein n=1 Tax=Pseudanabaena sp. PCC 6802 TaxID=118173 RepID=UPI0003470C80|nr:deoxyribodipyrimidine photo-lyase [Pseudanabaena sp. PCC 6802]
MPQTATLESNHSLTIVWHRRDLRIDDNPALHAASQQGAIVVGIFIFDPAILKSMETGGGKVDFMLGCLRELQANYQQLGSDLLCFYGEPVQTLRQVAEAFQVKQVFFNCDIEPYARQRDGAARDALKGIGVELKGFIDIGLHDPAAIATNSGEPYKVYTPFWRNWISLPKPHPYGGTHPVGNRPPRMDKIANLGNYDRACQQAGAIALPTLSELGFSHNQILPKSGESAAQSLLDAFCDSNLILRYKEARDIPSQAGTSMLSPHLRFGTIGIRRVWQSAIAATDRVRSEEEANGIQTWQQELAWREFYQNVLFHFPELAIGAYRPQMQRFEWDDNRAYFAAWCEGRTGYPIVDAAMRQLNQTGWMHNRCRMIVASFLTKDLLLNWQWGELYFMQQLVDGDLAANNGGWQWSASSGMDTKPLRIFNPMTQARKYDPEAEYILQWLPELQGLTTAELLSGNIPPHQCRKHNYPTPIVAHDTQQRIFKSRYQAAKDV